MDVNQELSQIALVLGEPARVLMLWCLLDGKPRPAGELAFFANVSAQSASLHLAKLVGAGMLTVTSQGRHRYYTIARPEVAYAIESMASLIPSAARAKPVPHSHQSDLQRARTCYDHLAGKVAIELVQGMEKAGLMTTGPEDFLITETGEKWLAEFGISLAELRSRRRSLARKCLDWSERQYHLGGALGAALLQEFFNRTWLIRRGGRVLSITLEGRTRLFETFGVSV